MKTFKRETAWALLGFLAALALYDVLCGGGTAALAWGELLALPFIGFATAAFGLDAAIKQGGWGASGSGFSGRRSWDQATPDDREGEPWAG